VEITEGTQSPDYSIKNDFDNGLGKDFKITDDFVGNGNLEFFGNGTVQHDVAAVKDVKSSKRKEILERRKVVSERREELWISKRKLSPSDELFGSASGNSGTVTS